MHLHSRLRLSHLSPQLTHSNTNMGCLVCVCVCVSWLGKQTSHVALSIFAHLWSMSAVSNGDRVSDVDCSLADLPPKPPSALLRFPKLEFCPTWFIWSLFFPWLGFQIGRFIGNFVSAKGHAELEIGTNNLLASWIITEINLAVQFVCVTSFHQFRTDSVLSVSPKQTLLWLYITKKIINVILLCI